jgi:peptidoglycan hydrolase-like protein with peptidoglycan-binding domain
MRATFQRGLVLVAMIAVLVGMPAASLAQGTDTIRQAQSRLATLGFDPGTADGLMGPRTRAAIRAYQRQSALPVTGALDAATLQGLGVGTAAAPGTPPAAGTPSTPTPPASTVGAVRDWAPLPSQAEIDRLVANPINDPQFPYTDYRPNAPAANLDVPGAAVLAAMNAAADRFGSRRPGQPGGTDRGYRAVNGCLRTGLSPTHWSDLMMHYYCQLSLATRTCYSAALAGRSQPAGRIYPRVESYQRCANGTLPNAADFAWAATNQPLVLQYLTFAQTNAFNPEQEQAVVNAFYGVRNPADRAECRQRRPLRTEDPNDGTHCLATKTMRIPLVGRNR